VGHAQQAAAGQRLVEPRVETGRLLAQGVARLQPAREEPVVLNALIAAPQHARGERGVEIGQRGFDPAAAEWSAVFLQRGVEPGGNDLGVGQQRIGRRQELRAIPNDGHVRQGELQDVGQGHVPV